MARKQLLGIDWPWWVYGAIMALIPTVVGIIVWASKRARNGVGRALEASWDWLLGPFSIPRVLVLAAGVTIAAIVVPRLRASARERTRRVPGRATLADRSTRFRDDFEEHIRQLAGWKRAVHDGNAYTTNESASTTYREGKRSLTDSYRDVAPELQAWLTRIDEYYTTPSNEEPVWGDAVDGPDESLDSIFTKFWRPPSFIEAFEFWRSYNPAEFLALAEERIDLLDSFVDSIRRHGDPRARAR